MASIKHTHEKFISSLSERQPELFSKIAIKSRYIELKGKILVGTIYGDCLVYPRSLVQGSFPSIQTAINPIEYFRAQYQEKFGLKYLIPDQIYISSLLKIKVICKDHGEFEANAANLLMGQGCKRCNNINISKRMIENSRGWDDTSWEEAGKRSKEFDSYKVYIIKCFNENESFYKIGKTFRETNKRFHAKHFMPYQFEPVVIHEGDAKYISELERSYHKKYKAFKYSPKIAFQGMSECFDINIFNNE